MRSLIHNPRSLATTFIAIAFLVFSFFLHEKLSSTVPIQPSLKKVRIAQAGDSFLYLPLYYAQTRGFFEKHGLKVEIVDSGSDESSITAVIDGDVAFAVGDPTFSPIASQRGAKTRVIAGILNRMPFCGVTFKQEISVISEPRQLGEYSVATFPSPSMAYTVQSQMFKEGGLRPNIRQIEFGSLLRALESDAADIVLDIEPNVSIAVREGARVLYSLAARYGEISVVGVIVSEETIDKNKQDVEALVQAIDEAEQFAYVNPSDIESFAVKRFSQLDPYAVGAAIARMLKNNALPRTAEISQNAWKNAIQLRVQSGELVSLNDAMAYRDMSFIPK